MKTIYYILFLLSFQIIFCSLALPANCSSLKKNRSCFEKSSIDDSEMKYHPEYLNSIEFQDLLLKDNEELRLLRNHIFARHGHSFKSKDLREYFQNKSWYRESINHIVSTNELSEDERVFIDTIIQIEKGDEKVYKTSPRGIAILLLQSWIQESLKLKDSPDELVKYKMQKVTDP